MRMIYVLYIRNIYACVCVCVCVYPETSTINDCSLDSEMESE